MDPYQQFNDPRRILISLPDDGPMRPKHVAGNKYSIVKYWLIINHFVVVTANQTIYKCPKDQNTIFQEQEIQKWTTDAYVPLNTLISI
jgi:hypothetical protein